MKFHKYVSQLIWSTFNSIEQISIANALFSTMNFWQLSLTNVNFKHDHDNFLFDQFNSIHTIENEIYQSYVIFCCVKNKYIDEDDKRSLIFSTLLSANDETQIDINVQQNFESISKITKFEISRSNFFRKNEIDSNFHLKWIEFFEINFNDSSIDAIILFLKHDDNQIQNILTCNLTIDWNLTKLKYDVAQFKIMNIFKNRKIAISIKIFNQFENEQIVHYITFDYSYFFQKRTYFQNHFVTRATCFNVYLKTKMLIENWLIIINITRNWVKLFSARFEHSNIIIFNEIMQKQI